MGVAARRRRRDVPVRGEVRAREAGGGVVSVSAGLGELSLLRPWWCWC